MEDNEFDKYVESMQENGGMSDAAIEKDIEASFVDKPDYFDEDGNPHYFDEEEDDDITEEDNTSELTEEDLELCRQVIPGAQFAFTRELCEGEEGEFFRNKLKEIANKCRKITTNEDLYNEDMTHDIGFRYFLGSTEIYCTQLYPDENNPKKTDGYGFGYVILNGDLQMSEWGDIPISEIRDIDFMEMDYHIPEGKTVEKYLFERHPDYFDDPDNKDKSVHENSPLYNVEKKKINVVAEDIKKDFIDPSITEEQLYQSKRELEKIIAPVLKIKGQKSEMQQAFKTFREHGVFDITNKKIDMKDGQITAKGQQELAAALEIYRNKSFETFRYLFIDRESGTIKDQLAVSSYLPNRSVVGTTETLQKVISHFIDTDTDVVVCHNHPSGRTEPSMDDISTTESLKKSLTNSNNECRLLGHIIIDHDTFSYYNPSNSEWNYVVNENNKGKEDPLLNKKEDFPIKETTSLKSTTQLESIAQQINDSNNWNDAFIPVTFLDSDNRINGLRYYSCNYFDKDVSNIKKGLKKTALANHSINAIPFLTERVCTQIENQYGKESLRNIEQKMKDCIKQDAFLDVYFKDGSLTSTYDLKPGKNYQYPIKTRSENSTFIPSINERLFTNSDKLVKEENTEYKTKKIKLSQESIDFYRNMAQTRKEQETGIVNILYRKDLKDDTLYAIFPDHKFSKKDFWEYYSSSNENKAISPDCLSKKTSACTESEKSKIETLVKENILKGTGIKINEYQNLDDVPYFKDKKISDLTEQVKFLKNQNTTFLDSLEKKLSTEANTAKQVLNLQLTNNLTKEQINIIINNAVKQANDFRAENQNINSINHSSKKGRKA